MNYKLSAVGDNGIDWDKHWQEHSSDSDFHDVKAFDYFRNLLPENFDVLDLGCGSCKWYPAFKKAGARRYVGVDFSPVAVSLAKKKFHDVEVYLMKAEDINFHEEFDLVFTHTFLQHTKLKTKRKLIPRIWKALKPSGIFVIQEKCDVKTETTFTREGWIDFIVPYGFIYITSTPESDPRNGFVFKKVIK